MTPTAKDANQVASTFLYISQTQQLEIDNSGLTSPDKNSFIILKHLKNHFKHTINLLYLNSRRPQKSKNTKKKSVWSSFQYYNNMETFVLLSSIFSHITNI